ncbi:MAG: DUF418 domain-containing protein, partial [Acidimicrobiales bacterium]
VPEWDAVPTGLGHNQTVTSDGNPGKNPGTAVAANAATDHRDAAAPVAGNERITNLDTVRGVATLGILIMNAVSFGLPDPAYFNIDAAGSDRTIDRIVGILGEIFVDQKTMALFSLLFGAGIVVFADRAEAKGYRATPLSLWRNLLLLGIGLAHSMLWEGDILTVYALCAPALLLLRKQSPRLLLVVGTSLVLSSAVVAAMAQTTVDPNGAGLGDYWFLDRGGMGDGVGLFLLFDFFARALGMMLIGVALYRLDIVQGNRDSGFYRRMAFVGLGVGLPIAASGIAWQLAADFSPDIAVISQAPNTVATIPVALGYLGLITLWNRSRETGLHLRVRAVGRMALTNYLAHSIIGVTVLRVIFDRGQFGRATIAGFVVSVWVLQLLWSKPWLQRFAFGPFEWAWRCATYRKLQPIRRG